jgi:hypothetical protein
MDDETDIQKRIKNPSSTTIRLLSREKNEKNPSEKKGNNTRRNTIEKR